MRKKGVANPGRYIGVYPMSQIPTNVVHTQLDRTEKHKGKEVFYYHVWVKEKTIKGPFAQDEEPQPQKVSAWDKFFKSFFSLEEDQNF